MTQGQVTAILYCQLATSLRSLAIILLLSYTYYHSHPRLQPYSYNYHLYANKAERWRKCPYTRNERSIFLESYRSCSVGSLDLEFPPQMVL
jgi:hypothetical protein